MDDELIFAFETAQSAGRLALQYFRQPLAVSNKQAGESFDPVTVADAQVEAEIRAAVMARFPGHSILGEEQAYHQGDSDYCWVIDPIDGTRSFISGAPTWGILLGLRRERKLVLGLMHQPYTAETWLANDTGAWFVRGPALDQAAPIQCRVCPSLGEATLYSTHPDMFSLAADRRAFDAIARTTKLLRYGGDCYAYCLLAHGQIDLVVEAGLQSYDIMPLVPIIEAAGGVVSNWQGESAAEGGNIVAAGSSALHAQALDIIARQ